MTHYVGGFLHIRVSLPCNIRDVIHPQILVHISLLQIPEDNCIDGYVMWQVFCYYSYSCCCSVYLNFLQTIVLKEYNYPRAPPCCWDVETVEGKGQETRAVTKTE